MSLDWYPGTWRKFFGFGAAAGLACATPPTTVLTPYIYMLALVSTYAVVSAGAKPDAWAPVRAALDGWQFTDNFAVTVGNASGPLFHYTHGNFSLDTPVETASTSKWPLAMMMVGLVADGTIGSLDDKASKYVPWWTTDPKDLKSTVTLRHLLSFTSAFGGGIPGQENTTKTCMDSNKTTDYMACAQQIYAQTNLSGTPGAFYSCGDARHRENRASAARLERPAARRLLHRRRCTSLEPPLRLEPRPAAAADWHLAAAAHWPRKTCGVPPPRCRQTTRSTCSWPARSPLPRPASTSRACCASTSSRRTA